MTENYMLAPEPITYCQKCRGEGLTAVRPEELSQIMAGLPFRKRREILQRYHQTGMVICGKCNGSGYWGGRL